VALGILIAPITKKNTLRKYTCMGGVGRRGEQNARGVDLTMDGQPELKIIYVVGGGVYVYIYIYI
jgi:hypothetical protein